MHPLAEVLIIQVMLSMDAADDAITQNGTSVHAAVDCTRAGMMLLVELPIIVCTMQPRHRFCCGNHIHVLYDELLFPSIVV